jgi:hypothetical protein
MNPYPFPRGLLRLPADVLFLILDHLSPQELFTFGQLSRAARSLVYNNGRYAAPATFYMVRNLLRDIFDSNDLEPGWLFEGPEHDEL